MGIEKVTGAVMNTVSQSAAKSQKIGELVNVLAGIRDKKSADAFVCSAAKTPKVSLLEKLLKQFNEDEKFRKQVTDAIKTDFEERRMRRIFRNSDEAREYMIQMPISKLFSTAISNFWEKIKQ